MKTNNSSVHFVGTAKMADLILTNYALLPVLQRLDIPLGFGEKTVSEVCLRYAVDENLFLLVCNVYTFDHYLPNTKKLAKLNIENLLTYLVLSHNYYRSEKLAEIECGLRGMSQHCSEKQLEIILSFFEEYRNELEKHFTYEEESLFPYFHNLLQGNNLEHHQLDLYETNHIEIEDKLSDLKNILIKYLPQPNASKERNEVLFRIFLLEEDLNKHALMEEKILIPFVDTIKKGYEQ